MVRAVKYPKPSRLSPGPQLVSLPPPRPHPPITTTPIHKLIPNEVRHINRTRLATDQPKVFIGSPFFEYKGPGSATFLDSIAIQLCSHCCSHQAVRTINSQYYSGDMPRRGRPMPRLVLSAHERDALEHWARRRTVGAIALRSRIVLASADGQPNNIVAEEFGVTPQTVGKWRARFIRRRLDGLADEPRPGAPRRVTDDLAARVVDKILGSIPRNERRWTTRSMARATGLSQTSVVRIWKAHGLQLRRRRGQRPVLERFAQIVRLPRHEQRRSRSQP